jgi:probable selenium-dependent hydroxylase accessory protein YqeC
MVSLREGLMLEGAGVVSLVGAGGKTSLMFRLARELSAAGETVLTTTTTKIFKPSADQSTHLILSGSVSRILGQARQLLENHPHITAAPEYLRDKGKLRGLPPEVVEAIWHSHLFHWIIVEADGAAGRPLKAPAEHEPVIPDCTTRLVAMVGLNGAGKPLTAQWVFRPERFAHLAGIDQGAEITDTAVQAVLLHENGSFKNAPAKAARLIFCNHGDVPENLTIGRRIARMILNKKDAGLKRLIIGQTLFEPPVLEVYDFDSDSEHEQ